MSATVLVRMRRRYQCSACSWSSSREAPIKAHIEAPPDAMDDLLGQASPPTFVLNCPHWEAP